MPETRNHSGEEHLAYWTKRLPRATFVYVIQGDPNTPIKVGLAKDPKARMRGLQTGNPYILRLLYVLPGDAELEWQLHQRLRRSRLCGEWFVGEQVESFLAFVSGLADEMVKSYTKIGGVPHWRKFSGDWVARMSKKVTVSFAEPAVTAEQAEANREAARQRRLRRWTEIGSRERFRSNL